MTDRGPRTSSIFSSKSHLNALLVSPQLVLIAFSALLTRLLASLSNCCEANLELRESWRLF